MRSPVWARLGCNKVAAWTRCGAEGRQEISGEGREVDWAEFGGWGGDNATVKALSESKAQPVLMAQPGGAGYGPYRF